MNINDHWEKAAAKHGIDLEIEYGLHRGGGVFMTTEWLFQSVEASVEQGWKYEFDGDSDELWEVEWSTWADSWAGKKKVDEPLRSQYLNALKEAIQGYLNTIAS
ncbi:hypothetical protein ABE484_02855 [Pseudomonas pudica]|uniref:hypothetical protein n=1 Tax=Pseudomonas TaxID=286 RepID=UPI00091F6555|nr:MULTISPECIES: hypothetical protein [Pseudomonas]OII57998.1 hypothetical protein BIW19_02355 [Pseudomonas putida]GLO42106.1 hypothetical protein PPUN15366_37530 [Pseudomonas putida]HDS0975116.1 hypothetical protein [Pseudomonas putida]